MRVWILSSDSEATSTKKLALELESRGHVVSILNPLEVQFQTSKRTFTFFVESKKQPLPDLVVPRLGWKTMEYGLLVAYALKAAGCKVVNSPESIELSSHKMKSLLYLAAHGLPVPTSKMAYPEIASRHHLLPNEAQVFKLLHGSQGFGVTLAKTKAQAKAQVDLLRSTRSLSLTQEFLKEARGEDIRAFIIGNKVIASMKRKAPKGDFRSNLHQGGTSKTVQLTPK